MELSDFKTLFRAQTLEEKVAEHLEQIRLHNQRIEVIDKQRNEGQELLDKKQAELTESKEQLHSGEREHHDLTQTIQKAKEHLDSASTQKVADSLESEITNLSPKADELENMLLELMDKVEADEQEIEKCKVFLAGSVETLKEIQAEVDKDISSEEKEIEDYNKKVEGLLSEIPENLKSNIVRVNVKFLYKKPLSFAINRECHQCKTDIGGNAQTQIDTGRVLEFCPSCGRILIPLAVKS
jgi:predicted  nucleic acid-binding Zn-ribbon protein